MKACNKCREIKPFDAYSSNGKIGFHPVCKLCRSAMERARRLVSGDSIRMLEKAQYCRNREAKKASIKKYYIANKERILDNEKARSLVNAEHIRAVKAIYRKNNPQKIRELNGTRRAIERRAMPLWADRERIKEIYKLAHEIWATTGVEQHVDHIIPLRGKFVSGLHVPENLQVISAKDNLSKSNKYQG